MPHRHIHRFERDKLIATPWKNGGGSTCEIACWPPGSGMSDFGWRVSIARIAAPGPFSVFPGIDRIITLLEGDGVSLQAQVPALAHQLDTPGEPFAFPGEAAIDCSLLGGPSSDLNVMTRRGQWQAELQLLDHAREVAAAPHGVLLAWHGSWQPGPGEPQLTQGQGLVWTDKDIAWRPVPKTPGAQLLAIRLFP